MASFYSKTPSNLPPNNQMNKPSMYQNNPQKLSLNDNFVQQLPMFPVIAASSHPLISLGHIILKIAVVAIYLIFPIFSDSFVIKQLVIILAAIDFWIIKNISGRLLVGLRWWVDFDEKGDQKWKFECKVNQNNVNPADDKVFWWTLALFTLIWLILSVANIITINITNVMICVFCFVMLAFNLYSYYKCSKAQSQNIKKLTFQYGTGMAAKFMTGSIIATYF